jgi:hypothetical protein
MVSYLPTAAAAKKSKRLTCVIQLCKYFIKYDINEKLSSGICTCNNLISYLSATIRVCPLNDQISQIINSVHLRQTF